MRYFLTVLLLILTLHADECENHYAQTQTLSSQVDALIKSNIASYKAYEIINNYLDQASVTIAACANSESRKAFRITRELNADMRRVSAIREKFRVQTFNELKEAAKIQAKKEVQCTNIYNNTYIRRNNDGPSTQPIKE